MLQKWTGLRKYFFSNISIWFVFHIDRFNFGHIKACKYTTPCALNQILSERRLLKLAISNIHIHLSLITYPTVDPNKKLTRPPKNPFPHPGTLELCRYIQQRVTDSLWRCMFPLLLCYPSVNKLKRHVKITCRKLIDHQEILREGYGLHIGLPLTVFEVDRKIYDKYET